ncbi:MAG: hypothetical protein GY803_11225 [Chloroflexi bacterium]|nr:hypothetical protein [Chloroflexota bacterium]
MKSVNNVYPKSNRLFIAVILIGLIFLLTVLTIQAETPNDDLADATEVTSFPFSEIIDNTGNSPDPEQNERVCGFLGNSFWYTFTPTIDGYIDVTAVSDAAEPRIGLYTGQEQEHPLDEIHCQDYDNFGHNSENFNVSVTADTVYYVRIASFDSDELYVEIDFSTGPTLASFDNDDLAAATEVTAFPFSQTIDNTEGEMELDENDCEGWGGFYSFWYTFTPTIDGYIDVTANGDAADPRIGLYTVYTDLEHPLNEIHCQNYDNLGGRSENFSVSVTAGTIYYVRIGSADPGIIAITIDFSSPTISPFENDYLAEATEVTSFPFSEIIDNTDGSVEENPNENVCESGDYSFWYTFTPTINGYIDVTAVSYATNPTIGLYTGSGHPLTEIHCQDSNNIGRYSERFIVPVNVGTIYYIRIGSDVPGTIAITIDVPTLAPFNNDHLAYATEVIPSSFSELIDNTDGSVETDDGEVECNTFGAKPSSASVEVGAGDDYSFWYKFTPTSAGYVEVDASNLVSSFGTIGLYTGTKQTHPLAEEYCDKSDLNGDFEHFVQPVTAGTTYYVRISSSAEGTISVDITLHPTKFLYYYPIFFFD